MIISVPQAVSCSWERGLVACLLALLPVVVWSQSDAERAVSLRDAVRQDQARLAELQVDLTDRASVLEKMALVRAGLEADLEDIDEQIQQSDLSSESLRELDAQRAELTERIASEKRKSEIVFEWAKGIRSQIRLVEENIEQNQAEVDRLAGDGSTVDKPAEPEAVADPTESRSPPGEVGMAGDDVLGTLPSDSAAKSPSAEAGVKPVLAETAEQIQARKKAEKTEAAAVEAERRLDQFVERKQLLQEQINLEQSQLILDEKGVAVVQEEITTVKSNIAAMNMAGEAAGKLAKAEERLVVLRGELDFVVTQIGERSARLELLRERMAETDAMQPTISSAAEKARRQAELAREESDWLSNPLRPANILRWVGARGEGILIAILIVGAALMLVRVFARRLIQSLIQSAQVEGQNRGRRAETLARSFTGVLTGLVLVIGLVLVLQEIGVDVGALLGGAAIFGVAVAFGAQNLMRDYFNGVMILLEDQYGLNDLVLIEGVEGRVERVNMRMTVIRDIEGRLHFIPNGQITHVTNRSYEWGQAKFDIPVPYDCDIDWAMAILMDEANKFCDDIEYTKAVAGKPEMLGVNEFADSAIIIRFVIKTVADQQLPVQREMLRRIKNRFDQEGISIPFPQRVVTIHKQE